MADPQTNTLPADNTYDPSIFTSPPAQGSMPAQYYQPDVAIGQPQQTAQPTQQQVVVPPPKPPVPPQQSAAPAQQPPPDRTIVQDEGPPLPLNEKVKQPATAQTTPVTWEQQQQQQGQQRKALQISSPVTDIGGQQFPARHYDYPRPLEGNILVRETDGGPGSDTVVSPKGAIGKFQIMPDTAHKYFPQYTSEQFEQLLKDPKVNQYVGRTIIQDLWNKYKGDQTLVMIGYNAGEGMVDKYLAAGRDPMVLPRETRKYIYGRDEAGSTDAYQKFAEGNKELQDIYTKEAATIQKEMEGLTAGSPEQRALADVLLRKQIQLMDKYEDMIAHPPTMKPLDMAQNFGSIATLIGIFGGMFSHAPLTASLNAAGAAMEAMNQGRMDDYNRAFTQWKSQAEMTQSLMTMESSTYRNILDDERLSLQDKMDAIKLQADVFQNRALAKQAEIGNYEKLIEYVDKHQEATDKHAQTMATIDEINARSKALQNSDRGLKQQALTAWYKWYVDTYGHEPNGDEVNNEIIRLNSRAPAEKTITPKEQQQNDAITKAKQKFGTPPINWQQVVTKQHNKEDITDDDTKGWSDDWKLLLSAMNHQSNERTGDEAEALKDYELSKQDLNKPVEPAGREAAKPAVVPAADAQLKAATEKARTLLQRGVARDQVRQAWIASGGTAEQFDKAFPPT